MAQVDFWLVLFTLTLLFFAFVLGAIVLSNPRAAQIIVVVIKYVGDAIVAVIEIIMRTLP